MKYYRPASFLMVACAMFLLSSCTSTPPAITPLPAHNSPPIPSLPVGLAKMKTHKPNMRVTMFKLGGNTANVTLGWDASADPTVSGYSVYNGGASNQYTNRTDAGRATSVTVSNLTIGTTYFFAATAHATNGLESGYSAEISYTVPNPSQTVGILVTLLTTTNINTPTINWQAFTNVLIQVPRPIVPTFYQSMLTVTNR